MVGRRIVPLALIGGNAPHEGARQTSEGDDIRVDDAQRRRAVVTLRVLAPNALRPIEDLAPVLYPGVKVSYGTIQPMLVEAEGAAGRLDAQGSLGGVEAGALDEMFSQGELVRAGVDLDSGSLFRLPLSARRDGEAWAGLLRECQSQGPARSVVVKGAVRGIAVGVGEVFPHAEPRDEAFMCATRCTRCGGVWSGAPMGRLNARVRRRWGDWQGTRAGQRRRRKAKHALSRARRVCAETIERFDELDAARDTLRGALECVDIHTGEVHRPAHVEALIERVAQCIELLGGGSARRSRSTCATERSAATSASGRPWGKTSPHFPATRSGPHATWSETMTGQPKFIASLTTSDGLASA